jgi:hypothetical protein
VGIPKVAEILAAPAQCNGRNPAAAVATMMARRLPVMTSTMRFLSETGHHSTVFLALSAVSRSVVHG